MGTIPKHIGKYDLLYEISTGAMGTVFRGRDDTLDRMVAIKMLSKNLFANIDHQLRFIQEAKIIAKLDDPRIIKIYGIEYLDGNAFLIMEYLEGKTLLELLEEKGKFFVKEATLILRQLAKALAHAHARGVVHLDIKPENVMVLNDGSIKLMDFGISLDNSSELDIPESHREQMGTPKYMSPEQFIKADVDFRSDIYSFGVLAYEMLTGFPPFKAKNRDEFMKKHIHEKPVPIQHYCKEIPSRLAKFINKSLDKTKDSRPQSLDIFYSSFFDKRNIEQELFIIWTIAAILLFLLLITLYIIVIKKHTLFKKIFTDKKTFVTELLLNESSYKDLNNAKALQNIEPKKEDTKEKLSEIYSLAELRKPEYNLIDYSRLSYFLKNSPFPNLIYSISSTTNNGPQEITNAINDLLWKTENELTSLIPFIHFNDEILVKNISYILGVRNITQALFSIKERIENETNENLLQELYKNLAYFDHPLAIKLLNKGFLETGSLSLLQTTMHGLYGNASFQSLEKAKLLLLVDDDNIKAEIYYFLATHNDLRGLDWAKKNINNSSNRLMLFSLKILSLSKNNEDINYILKHKRQMYQSIETMNEYKKCMINIKIKDLQGLTKYKVIEKECEKNKNLLAWAAYEISKEKTETSERWLKMFLQKYPLKNYPDYIRAYFNIYN